MSGETFGAMLSRLRFQVGLSQNRLARDAGIDPAYVNRLERASPSAGQLIVANPRRSVVLALARVLDLSESQTDRLLFAAGLAPQVDWQTRAVRAETAIATIQQAIEDATGSAEEPTFIRRAASR